jgi:hypothetical protein
MANSIFEMVLSIFGGFLSDNTVSASVTLPLDKEPDSSSKDPAQPKQDLNLYIETKYELKRTKFAENGIFGELSKDGTKIAYTIEHSYGCKPKLPNGTYTCKKGNHMLHSGPIMAFEVMNVPGHQGILIHPGNTEADSEGCILLGKTANSTEVLQSKFAFNEFMESLKDVNEFTLVVG